MSASGSLRSRYHPLNVWRRYAGSPTPVCSEDRPPWGGADGRRQNGYTHALQSAGVTNGPLGPNPPRTPSEAPLRSPVLLGTHSARSGPALGRAARARQVAVWSSSALGQRHAAGCDTPDTAICLRARASGPPLGARTDKPATCGSRKTQPAVAFPRRRRVGDTHCARECLIALSGHVPATTPPPLFLLRSRPPPPSPTVWS